MAQSSAVQCSAVHPRRKPILKTKISENPFFNYKKIRTDVFTLEKKFHNFLTTNYQLFLGANFS